MKEEDIPLRKIQGINTEIITLIRKSENELKEIMAYRIEDKVDDKVRK